MKPPIVILFPFEIHRQVGRGGDGRQGDGLVPGALGGIKDPVRITEDGLARRGGCPLPTVGPELSLFAHQLIDPRHQNRPGAVEKIEEGIEQDARVEVLHVPRHGRPCGVAGPESLRVQTLIRPPGDDCAHQVGLSSFDR